MRTARFFENRKSQVLIVSVIVMILVLTLGAGLLFNSRTFRDITDLELDIQKAGSLSRSGIGIMQTLVAQSGCGDPLDPSYTYNFGDGTIEIVVDSNAKTITSTGRSGQSTDVKQINYESSPASGWDYRHKITIYRLDTWGINTDLLDFPVLVKMNLDESHVAKSNGGDIHFRNSTLDTQLDHEIEEYDSSGNLIAWVRVPVLQAAAETIIYVLYGDPDLPDQWNPAGVWDSNYLAVWHMKEDPTNPAPQFKDSADTNDGTRYGAPSSGQRVTGMIGYSSDFDGSNDFIIKDGPSNIPSSCPVTLSAWAKSTNSSQASILWTGNMNSTDDYIKIGSITRKIALNIKFFEDDFLVGTVPNDDGQWHFIVGVFASRTDRRLYVDGLADGTDATDRQYPDWPNRYAIGYAADSSPDSYFNGRVDEARISNVVRSADWIKAEYRNQGHFLSFMTFNAEETCGGGSERTAPRR